MFVRNNITCPNCGKVTHRDVYVDDSDVFEDFILIRSECSDCMGFQDGLLSYSEAMCFLLQVTESLVCRDRRRRCHRWKRSPLHSKKKAAIYSNVLDVLERGAFDWKFAEHWLFLALLMQVGQPSGNPNQICLFPSFPLYRWYPL